MVTPLTEVKAVTGEKTFTLHCVYNYAFVYKNVPDGCTKRGSRVGPDPMKPVCALPRESRWSGEREIPGSIHGAPAPTPGTIPTTVHRYVSDPGEQGRFHACSFPLLHERFYGKSIGKALLSALFECYDIADGHGHPPGSTGGGGVFSRVDQPDLECSLKFFPEIVFGDEITLFDLSNEDLTLLNFLCEVEGRPAPLFPGETNPVGIIFDDLPFHQVKDIARPFSGLRDGEARFILDTSLSWLLDFCTVFCTSDADTELCTLDLDSLRRSLYGSTA